MPVLALLSDTGFIDSGSGTGATDSGVQFNEGSFSSPCPCCGGYHANFDSSDFGPLAFLNADERGGTATNSKPSLTVTDAGVQITRTNQSWTTGAMGTAANVTFAFRSTAPSSMPADTTGFTRFTEVQITAALASLQAWSDVANITFSRINDGDGYSDNATILFGDYASGQAGAAAFAYMPGNRSVTSSSGDVWVNYTGTSVTPALLNYGQHTLTHEIGHAIGLSHPAAYNAAEGVSITYGADAIYYEDSRQYTVMSYFSETNTGASYRATNGTFANQYSAVPLLDDIAAAQRLYGANMTTRTGDTVYGFNSTADRAWFSATSFTTSLIFAVWDAGGVDTLDFSGYNQAATIDLRQGSFSSVGGLTGNIAIAMGAVIENAIGGAGSDRIYGNSADNRLSGGPLGADVIDGGLGTDTVVFSGLRANYTITWNGQVGTVTANGNPQSTTITNVEFLAFQDQTIAAAPTGGLNVSGDTTNDTMNGTAFGDTLSGAGGNDIIYGLGGNDTLTGGTGNDQISGGDGDDIVVGGSGNDALDGGAGTDLADYMGATSGVVVSLTAGTASGGAGSDTLTGFENLRGTTSADTLIGDAGANVIRGGGGSDTIYGGAGNDIIYAGVGGASGGAPDIVKAQSTANVDQAAAVSLDGGFDLLSRSDVQDSSTTPHATVNATSSGNAEWYSFTTSAAMGSVTIDIDNASFDSVIRVYDANGQLVATNDDGTTVGDFGNETDSALTFPTSAAGVYYVEVTEWVSNTPSLTTHAIPAGQTYTLHVSVPWHSTAALTQVGSALYGEDGDDQFFQGFNPDGVNDAKSSDTIDGGAGTDTVNYFYLSNNYTISTTNGVTTVTDNSNGSVDTLINVEQIQFNDRLVYLGTPPPPTTINGTTSTDTLQGTAGRDALYGFEGDDFLYGYASDDLLIGGSGNDTMVGGTGDDTYEVTETGDVVVEIGSGGAFEVNEGVDTVFSYVNGYRLTTGVENLRLVGSAQVGYGNNLSNTLVGNALDNTLVGGGGADTMVGGAGNDAYEVTEGNDLVIENAGEGSDTVFSYLDTYALTANVEVLALVGSARVGYGNALANTLIGNALANTLVGGAGNDTMIGGAGNDAYEVTEAGDVVIENPGEGIDTVYSYINGYALAANVETLALVGSAQNGYGNALDNTLIGNALANTLIGGAGNDTMIGGGGNDAYEVTEAGDVVVETIELGYDTVYSFINSYTLTANVEGLYLMGAARDGIGNTLGNRIVGNGFDNLLNGGAGDDILIGGVGNDTMIGGTGNDIFEVTEAGDVVTENAGEGLDTVYSYLDSYTLTANVENLQLVGGARNGIGNALDNRITGNGLDNLLNGGAGNDVLIGGAGNDTMIGGLGNDAYEITEAGDVVVEAAGEGADTVYSYIDSYQLTDNVETLALVGSARIGLGNAGANTLIGNAGANVLNGNGGDDVLTGGAGADTFWHLGAAAGNDRITDFTSASEVIVLDASVYANFGAVQSHAAQIGANVVITLNASTSLTLANVQLNQLTASNFVFFNTGGAGAPEPVAKTAALTSPVETSPVETSPVETSPVQTSPTEAVDDHAFAGGAFADDSFAGLVGGRDSIPLHLLADVSLAFDPAPWTLPHDHWA
jgi:serralysin